MKVIVAYTYVSTKQIFKCTHPHPSIHPPTHTHTHTHTHTEDARPASKSARIDSQSSDTQEGGTTDTQEGVATDGGKKKKKKNRQHKKKSSSSLLKELDQLRVMSK